MKRSIKTLLGLAIAVIFVFNSCKDDDTPQNTPVGEPDWNKVELDSTDKNVLTASALMPTGQMDG